MHILADTACRRMQAGIQPVAVRRMSSMVNPRSDFVVIHRLSCNSMCQSSSTTQFDQRSEYLASWSNIAPDAGPEREWCDYAKAHARVPGFQCGVRWEAGCEHPSS